MISIRTATEDDAEELLAIYAPSVKQTAITFEYDVPSKKDFKSRISHTLEKYPYLVAEEDGTEAKRHRQTALRQARGNT